MARRFYDDEDYFDDYGNGEGAFQTSLCPVLMERVGKEPFPVSSLNKLFSEVSRRRKAGFGKVRNAFNFMVDNGFLTIIDDKVQKAAEPVVRTGTVRRDANGAQVVFDDDFPPMLLSSNESYKPLPDDVVKVQVDGICGGGLSQGKLLELVKRPRERFLGYVRGGKGDCFEPMGQRYKGISFHIVSGAENVGKQDIIVAELVDKGFQDGKTVRVDVVENLGNQNDKGVEIEVAVRKFDVPYQFSDETVEVAKRFPDHVTKTHLRNRVDLRDVPFVTIDGPDAKDFDDAVYCCRNGEDGYRLLVAIADVSYYVKPGSPLDKDAQERTTSVYFPTQVIPMLPEELSNGLCSLNPDVDRLTMVCDALVDGKGQVTAYQFYPAVIHSAARLIYENVWEAIRDPKSLAAAAMREVYPQITDLYALFKVLLGSRSLRGAMDFETVETYVVANDQGKIEKILPRERNDAHRLIEEMMLVANTCAADFIARNNAESLFRIHEPPSEEKVEKARSMLGRYGITLGGGAEPTPVDYSRALSDMKDNPNRDALQTVLLRSMKQAVYSPDNLGHFGLAYPAYTHFTSPIRRYPDLLVHRTIRAILAGRKYHPKVVITPNLPDEVQETLDSKQSRGGKDHKTWELLGTMCSAFERRADAASYDVMAWLKCVYMKQFIGCAFSGTVTGVSQYALYITLDDIFVEGSIHISQIGDNYYVYDESDNSMSCPGEYYGLGTKVRVKVVRCDSENRRIDLQIIRKRQR